MPAQVRIAIAPRKAPLLEEHNPVEPIRILLEAADQESHEVLSALGYLSRCRGGNIGISILFALIVRMARDIAAANGDLDDMEDQL